MLVLNSQKKKKKKEQKSWCLIHGHCSNSCSLKLEFKHGLNQSLCAWDENIGESECRSLAWSNLHVSFFFHCFLPFAPLNISFMSFGGRLEILWGFTSWAIHLDI